MVRRFRFVAVIAVVFALLVAAGAVYAQGPGGGRRGGRGAFGPGGEFRGLKLSDAQRQQIQQFSEQYRQQVFSVLTPEQQQLVQQRRTQAEQRMKERLERRQQRQQQ
jgi:Spy/CpxP family protein refolding chaperone